jgi:hypothetical protein
MIVGSFRGKICGILNVPCVFVDYGMVGLMMILHVSRWWIYLSFASGG